nr:MAG: hypothetical protein [Microvirus sp.]
MLPSTPEAHPPFPSLLSLTSNLQNQKKASLAGRIGHRQRCLFNWTKTKTW